MPTVDQVAEAQARKRASAEKWQSSRAGVPPVDPQSNGANPLLELMPQTPSKTVTLTSGKVFTIQGLLPGHVFEALGTPLMSLDETTADGQPNQQREIELSYYLIRYGVIKYKGHPIRFVNKDPHECDLSQNEISVKILRFDELNELALEINKLNVPEGERETVQSFRVQSENGQRDALTDLPDREVESDESVSPDVRNDDHESDPSASG